MKYEYTDSGIEWIGEIPKHWNLTTIKKEFLVIPSNVDKKTEDDETEVKLCNYVDVYYNDFINSSIDFMIASATDNEINKFQLEVGDVLITKDSEDPRDIAVPAFVTEVEEKLLCGYHLSMLRTINNSIDGSFLFWAFKDEVIVTQLWREATGITRWAIASRHIKNSTIPFPLKPEQIAIAKYLDKACADIDRVVEIKRKQLINLQKQLKSIIHHTITNGLNPKSEMIESGIDWIGKTPKHWRKEKIFRAAEFVTSGGTPKSTNEEYYYDGNIPWIQSGDLNDGYITETEKKITNDGLQNSSAKLFPKDTLLVAMYGATIGKLGIQTMEAATNQACCAIFPVKRIALQYLYYFFLAIRDKYISD
ncbi:MAG: restriction endonuclease subunit S, partial [Ignavibacteria bacterium]|nr:restriction endonuclease subunit S [Ignavibacteria bacterium]